MILQFAGYKLNVSIVPTLATALIFPILLGLGFWQLDRAEEKKQIEAKMHALQNKSALQLNNVDTDYTLEKHQYQDAVIHGHYETTHQWLLDNRTHKGKAGYHVLTPFFYNHGKQVILVNRGWIPWLNTRNKIPDITVSDKTMEIQGTIKIPSKGIVLNDKTAESPTYPKVIQAIAFEQFEKELFGNATFSNENKQSLHLVLLELNKDQQYGFVRDWQPFYGSVSKHYSYALQWFLMAALLLFLYLKLNIKKRTDTHLKDLED